MRRIWLAAALVLLCGAAGGEARVLAPWGSSLGSPATLDTANGSYGHAASPREHAISPLHHDAADLAVWNVRLPHRSASAPQAGQVLAVRVRGCAREDTSAPTQRSPSGPGTSVPANTINLQVLVPGSGGSFSPIATAAYLTLPFCSSSSHPESGRVSTSTVTSYHPVHLCIARGDTVDFADVGGFVPAARGRGPAYPQGVPFLVLAATRGAQARSFADIQAGGPFRPGRRPAGANSGWGAEPGEELLLQVVEGVGADAYGLCPGGRAVEGSSSNTISCVSGAPTDGHRLCGHAGDPSGRRGPYAW